MTQLELTKDSTYTNPELAEVCNISQLIPSNVEMISRSSKQADEAQV